MERTVDALQLLPDRAAEPHRAQQTCTCTGGTSLPTCAPTTCNYTRP